MIHVQFKSYWYTNIQCKLLLTVQEHQSRLGRGWQRWAPSVQFFVIWRKGTFFEMSLDIFQSEFLPQMQWRNQSYQHLHRYLVDVVSLQGIEPTAREFSEITKLIILYYIIIYLPSKYPFLSSTERKVSISRIMILIHNYYSHTKHYITSTSTKQF